MRECIEIAVSTQRIKVATSSFAMDVASHFQTLVCFGISSAILVHALARIPDANIQVCLLLKFHLRHKVAAPGMHMLCALLAIQREQTDQQIVPFINERAWILLL